MTTITTAAAAAQAGVTVATIRNWCRRGAVDAVKVAGRWVIDPTSLARRIAIGAMRARKKTATGTLVMTDKGLYAVRGNAQALAAAHAAGTPVALDNAPYAGDRIYLGLTHQTWGDYGITLETLGLAYIKDDGQAVYYIDINRLDEAPAFQAALNELENNIYAAEAAADAADNAYFNPRYI